MHEVSLVQSLLERVEVEARAHGATSVCRVTVRIEPLAGVEPGLFTTAFDACRIDTLADAAELVLTGLDLCWKCSACGTETKRVQFGACPDCGWPARFEGGDALVLERIEMEVPNHV